jgi:hypothetical protein
VEADRPLARWQVLLGTGPDGKRRQKWRSGFKRKGDAEKALAQIIGRIDDGTYVSPSKMTLGAFLTDRWLPTMTVRVRPATFASYRGIGSRSAWCNSST